VYVIFFIESKAENQLKFKQYNARQNEMKWNEICHSPQGFNVTSALKLNSTVTVNEIFSCAPAMLCKAGIALVVSVC